MKRKQFRTPIHIPGGVDELFKGTPDEIIKKLEYIKIQFSEEVFFITEYSWGTDQHFLKAYTIQNESDESFNRRKKAVQKAKETRAKNKKEKEAEKSRKEKELYLKLKEKYEGD